MDAFSPDPPDDDGDLPPPSEQFQREHPHWDDNGSALRAALDIRGWAVRKMPEPDRLLGDLVTTTTRTFLVGRTGLGKTMLGVALATGIASGSGFLHWRSSRPGRVLYIDGEMPAELVKARAIDALRRCPVPIPDGNLLIFVRDQEEAFAKLFPSLGAFAPLNTEAGQNFVHALIGATGGVDVVIFDNVMSLVAGDQKDEVPWSETLPLVQALTAKRIGQVWLDHTGHDTSRQYGSSTKMWRFDSVGIMAALDGDGQHRDGLAFTLSFEHPGKARRRTPDNWRDFEAVTIRLKGDRWTSEPAEARSNTGKLPPSRRPFYDALVAAITASAAEPGRTTVETWQFHCLRRGLIEKEADGENYRQRDARYRAFRKAKADLLAAGWIAIDGDLVTDLHGRWA